MEGSSACNTGYTLDHNNRTCTGKRVYEHIFILLFISKQTLTNAQTVMEDVLKLVTTLEGATTVCAASDTLWPQTDMDVMVSELL